jgi:hypothetical protein
MSLPNTKHKDVGYYLKADSIYTTKYGNFLVLANIYYDNGTRTTSDDVVYCRTGYLLTTTKKIKKQLKKSSGLKVKKLPALSKTKYRLVQNTTFTLINNGRFLDVFYGIKMFTFASISPVNGTCNPDNCICITKCAIGKKRIPLKKLKPGKYRFIGVSTQRKEFATFMFEKN